MKSCPACQRTYEDTFTFCLVDGSVLSAPNKPNPTLGVTTPPVPGPAPTAILNPTTNPGGPRPQLSTIVAAQPLPLYPPKPPSPANGGQSRKPWLAIGIAVSVGLLLIAGTIIGFVLLNRDDAASGNSNSENANANVTSKTDCFAKDPAAGSTNRATHHSWANDQSVERLQRNLNAKLDLLFQCRSMNAEKLSDTYADASVVIAKYVHDPNCFAGDAGVVSTLHSDHKTWGLSRGSEAMSGGLEWKTASAFKCLDSSRHASFFADVSVAIAGGGIGANIGSDLDANSNSSRWGPTNDRASLNGERLTYYPVTTPEQCKADCDKDARCHGFTFIRAGTYNRDDSAMCYLMSVATEMVPQACCISGIKRR